MRSFGAAAIPSPPEGVKILAGDFGKLQRVSLAPYDECALSFLHSFSRALMSDAEAKGYPDVISFAYWCRAANIRRLAENFGKSETGLRRGRGIVFHIAPSNVPVNFAYSWAFALLSGCSSVVRVSEKDFRQVDIICRVLRGILGKNTDMESTTLILRYGHDEDFNKALCAVSDARVIWGGDETVRRFRAYPAKPRCMDLAFPDRWSLCLLDSAAVGEAPYAELSRLAESFYNDAYVMDQNACSSPKLVLWAGDAPGARERFWNAVSEITRRKYEVSSALASAKLSRLYSDAMTIEGLSARRYGSALYVVSLSEPPDGDIDALSGLGGYFYELAVDSPEKALELLPEKCQTLTYFGYSAERLREIFNKAGAVKVDRAVPVGRALDISVAWDGYDIVRELSRVITVGE